MAPKKGKATQTMSLGDFLSDPTLGGTSSWADEVEEYTSIGTQPLPPTDRPRNTTSAWGSGGGDRGDRGYATRDRDMFPTRLPDRPPYTAHLGNLSYDATVESVTEFFAGCSVTSVRIIEDREQQRPKGFAYAEFETIDGLKQALDLDGTPLEGRPMRIKIADPPRGGDREARGDTARDLSSWERKGPLPDVPSRNRDFGGERRGAPDFDRADRRQSREPLDDGKVRDFGNWERKGPLSPAIAPQMERQVSRDGSRSRAGDFGPRSESFRGNRKASPATWGEGRPQGEEGSRPPRREFVDRPERVPTAAEKDNQWRDRMRPDAPAKSPAQSNDGNEVPSSPAVAAASTVMSPPASRPRLHLQKRTVSEAPEVNTPTADSKASPFGAARPIDTAAREREVEVRRQQALKEKKEADEKAKEERRLAKEKEGAAKAETEAETEAAETPALAAAAPTDAPAEPAAPAAPETVAASAEEPAADKPAEEPAANADKPDETATADPAVPAADQKLPLRPKEASKFTSRATESGNWRSSNDRPRGGPGGREPRGRGGPRGGPRGGRNYDGGRDSRQNGSFFNREQRADQPPATPTTAAPAEDGWTTVTKDKRRSQGGGKLIV